MSETVQMWLFGGIFTALGALFMWVVSLRLRMARFTSVAEEIRTDVKECTEAIKAHEEREDKQMEGLRKEMQAVNGSLLTLAVKVGESSR